MNHSTHNLGPLVLRVTLGLVLLAHSAYLKGVVFTLPATAAFFVSLGLPAVLAYVVFTVEVVAGVALLIGYRVREVSIAMIPILLGATWAHLPNGWLFTNEGGGWEYPLVLSAMALAQAFLGAGAFAWRKADAKTVMQIGKVSS